MRQCTQNVTKISEFNEDFFFTSTEKEEKNYIEKITETKPVK